MVERIGVTLAEFSFIQTEFRSVFYEEFRSYLQYSEKTCSRLFINIFYFLTFKNTAFGYIHIFFYSLYNLLCLNLSFGKLSVGTSVFENDASGLVAKFCEKKKTQPESIGHQLCSTEIFLQSSLTIPRGLRPRWSTSVQSVGC